MNGCRRGSSDAAECSARVSAVFPTSEPFVGDAIDWRSADAVATIASPDALPGPCGISPVASRLVRRRRHHRHRPGGSSTRRPSSLAPGRARDSADGTVFLDLVGRWRLRRHSRHSDHGGLEDIAPCPTTAGTSSPRRNWYELGQPSRAAGRDRTRREPLRARTTPLETTGSDHADLPRDARSSSGLGVRIVGHAPRLSLRRRLQPHDR
jgi:hypothetical protein